jgi:tRNA(Glu) U13 pseudouridine synthase TruD
MNAGNIGRIHGDRNEPAPAAAETRILVSTINQLLTKLRINSFFQIKSICLGMYRKFLCGVTYRLIIKWQYYNDKNKAIRFVLTSSCYLATFLSTPTRNLSTLLAVFHILVFFTFFRAGITNLSTHATDIF